MLLYFTARNSSAFLDIVNKHKIRSMNCHLMIENEQKVI